MVFMLISWILSSQSSANIGMCLSLFRDTINLVDFSFRDGGLLLNPTSREVHWNGKTIQLTPMQYLILETLVGGNGEILPKIVFFEAATAETAANSQYSPRMQDKAEKEYTENWLIQSVIRLRKILAEKLDPALAERIKIHQSRGFSWLPESLIIQSQSFNSQKITYVRSLNRLFIGTTEVMVMPHVVNLVTYFAKARLFRLTKEQIQSAFLKSSGNQPSDNLTFQYLSRTNHDLSHVLGNENGPLPIVLVRTGLEKYYELNQDVFDFRD